MSSTVSTTVRGTSAPAPPLCANCGAVLLGRYCHACGQIGHVHRSLLHLAEELLHGVLHFDAKALRTLPLLAVRPGLLTRRYLDGQRVRYLNPLTLFLFCIFLLLFVVSIEPSTISVRTLTPAQRQSALTELEQQVDEANAQVISATAALGRARASGADPSDAQSELSAARLNQRIAAAALRTLRATLPQAANPGGAAVAGLDPWALLPANLAQTHPLLASALQDIRSNPRLYLLRLREAGSHFAFLLIPISLPFLSLLFIRRRDVVAYDHAVFSLYSLSFMSLLVVTASLLGVMHLSGLAAAIMVIVPPCHMFAQLRGTYRLGVAGAMWRTVALLGVAGTVFLMFLVLLSLIALR
ncbi:MAG TPA: DUF3667 domain-containing protein [Steroidobacteraceae bacterium]|nr:DUF3667 domain-containing protein [Steroidobacteraceae bacterium]